MASTAYSLPAVSDVVHPSHLEGDATLATEILPGPPSVVSIQQKKESKKPGYVYSYLPAYDPGTTYSGIMHGTLIAQDSLEASGKRARVGKSAVTGRAQRATTRGQAASVPAPEPAHIPVLEPETTPSTPMAVDEGTGAASSRSASVAAPNVAENGSRGKRKDAKGKEREHTLPELRNSHVNEDHCSSCRSLGSQLVYCDGCVRAFHLCCLDPPQEKIDSAEWFCPACIIDKHPPPPVNHPQPFVKQLVGFLDKSIPTEFQLPTDIRNFYKDVGTGPRGAYVDNAEIKQPRLNRFGQAEERDSFRLKDRNGSAILCHRCGTSAIPDPQPSTSTSTARPSRPRRSKTPALADTAAGAWKSIVSCDYCSLHWHLDCLDPPLSTAPPLTKKWMCPAHMEHVLPPRRRVPKTAAVVEISKQRQFNNGNIDIIPAQTSNPEPKVAVDEVLINGRRYRVPERIILLDFWSKIDTANGKGVADDESPISSPLTSLTSLSDLDEDLASNGSQMDDMSAAQLLVNFQSSADAGPSTSKPATNGKRKAASNTLPSITIPSKRKKSTPAASGSASARETRATRGSMRNGDGSVASSKSASRAPEEPMAPPPPRKIRVKMEETPSAVAPPEVPVTGAPPKPARPSRSRKKEKEKEAASGEPSTISHLESSQPEPAEPPKEKTSKHGKKRKAPEEDGDYMSKGSVAAANAVEATSRGRRKSARTGTNQTATTPPPSSTPAPVQQTQTPLKIRLRLNPPSAAPAEARKD
ncbi:hypothetical protein CYLTODRAFT_424093 [Cylindrobasidium torrendii FP15055 ss-10]|uniref:PHD-type domain-containing protein n=1 Tax=Cylindrobasidium torrendii FP15055 ss-10 TaxID=1314674 RepID=A0A0D7B6B2_9AGAR|nr:hypothetical protein CYLTODRAFT_424093 [Cylindrobasidium torrendii FP15055 ss-10]